MEIYVLNREMARKRIPEKPELLIGILGSKSRESLPVSLTESKFRVAYLTYTFDDIDEPFRDYVPINTKTAKSILEDFARFRNKIKSLAIHCNMGQSRSPAVAAALNDCFSLGNSSEDFFSGGYTPNRLVYRTLIRTARKIGIPVQDIYR